MATLNEIVQRFDDRISGLEQSNAQAQQQVESLERQVQILTEHNAKLAATLFNILMWENDGLATLLQTGEMDNDQRTSYNAMMDRFVAMQASVAPRTYVAMYGVDPVSNEAVGSGLFTDGTISPTALSPNIANVVGFDQ